MDDRAAREMRDALGLSRMLWMPNPANLGYERDNAQLPGESEE